MDADGCGDGSVWEGRVFRVESALRRQWFVERERDRVCVREYEREVTGH